LWSPEPVHLSGGRPHEILEKEVMLVAHAWKQAVQLWARNKDCDVGRLALSLSEEKRQDLAEAQVSYPIGICGDGKSLCCAYRIRTPVYGQALA
jgi:hypothetical protein